MIPRFLAAVAVTAFVAAACGSSAPVGELGGSIEIDGSSTVYPLTEAVAEEFSAETGGSVRVMVGFSGTGGGFKRFCAGRDGDQQCIEAHQGQRARAVRAERCRL
jgi:phosphate transport system substrate-binding protein